MSSTNENEENIEITLSTSSDNLENKSFEDAKTNEEDLSHTESTTVDDASKTEDAQDSGISLEIEQDNNDYTLQEVSKIIKFSFLFFKYNLFPSFLFFYFFLLFFYIFCIFIFNILFLLGT